MIGEIGGVETAAVMAMIESPEATARVTDLMLKASDRSNFEETLANLRERLTLIEAERPGRAASEALLAAPGDDGGRPDVDTHLAALHEGYSRRHHFSPQALCGTEGR
jgi:hypothetical protein